MIHDMLLSAIVLHFWNHIKIADTRLDNVYAEWVTFCEMSGHPFGPQWSHT